MMGNALSYLGFGGENPPPGNNGNEEKKDSTSNVYSISIRDLYGPSDEYSTQESISALAEKLWMNVSSNNYMINGVAITKAVCYFVAAKHSVNGTVDINKLEKVSNGLGCFEADIQLFHDLTRQTSQFYKREVINAQIVSCFIKPDVIQTKDGKQYVVEENGHDDTYYLVYKIPQFTYSITRKEFNWYTWMCSRDVYYTSNVSASAKATISLSGLVSFFGATSYLQDFNWFQHDNVNDLVNEQRTLGINPHAARRNYNSSDKLVVNFKYRLWFVNIPFANRGSGNRVK